MDNESHNNYDTSALTPALLPNAPPSFLISLVLGLRRFLLKLADSVVPADAAIFERMMGIGHTCLLGALARLGVADLLQGRALDAQQIADETNCNVDAIHRAMRGAVTVGVFNLSADGKFSNNRLSLALQSGRLSRSKEFAEYFSSKSNCRSYLEYDHILKTGEDGFIVSNKLDLWDWFDEHPDERETFAQIMMGVTNGEAPMVAKLYPFEEINRLCDVGGGRGALLAELVIRYPHLDGVLFDCEGVIASAKPLLKARGVDDKIELITGDFFESVEPGCDAYLLKNVMHDWDDGRCQIILENCRKVMSGSDRILLVEILLDKNETSNFASLRDIHVMTVCTGGRERSIDDYSQLLEASGFKMNRYFSSPLIAVIEGVCVDNN